MISHAKRGGNDKLIWLVLMESLAVAILVPQKTPRRVDLNSCKTDFGGEGCLQSKSKSVDLTMVEVNKGYVNETIFIDSV